MRQLLALVITAVASAVASTSHSPAIRPLTPAQKHAVVQAGEWHRGCPVTLSQLRVLTVPYYGFDHRTHVGQLVVNERVARPLGTVFEKLYRMRFPIRDMHFWHQYGAHPTGGDITASFECRDAVPSPCTGGSSTHTWSEHAYGEAVDLDPRENPYVGCGMTRDKTALSYLKRDWHRRGMVTPAVLQAFESIGWGWGGSWAGSTKDYMHFSLTGH
ncbi:MAG TPA: M15 family metallopeptidase [Gaiellaceae bacterium]|jgi:hypothetical protein|nr:M15 family metallopeptidase [Gaiellaceae bacterium]